MDSINVWKRNLQGEVTWRYSGEILERGADFVRLEALFNRDDMPFMGITLKKNDRFVETFFTDNWYNIFEIHDRDDDQIKGWYCNLGRPAVWDAPDTISYVDLALDLWVAIDGTQTLLDEDEFEALELDDATRAQVMAGLGVLQGRMKDESERMKTV
jgi:predicted RNA-binding protein associated with RNAse of E/G family